MNNIIWQLLQIIKKPRNIIFVLFYFISLVSLKIFFNVSNMINVFTLLFIPLTVCVIYIALKIVNSENIEDDAFDIDLKTKYSGVILGYDKSKIEKMMQTRKDIKKLLKKSHLNESKESLINRVDGINFNDLLQKYANNSVKIKFIEDFLQKKTKDAGELGAKIKQLSDIRAKYRKLNDDIYNSFDSLQAQAVLILADDVSTDMGAEDSIVDVMDKIKNLEVSNEEINKFYVSIHKGDVV